MKSLSYAVNHHHVLGQSALVCTIFVCLLKPHLIDKLWLSNDIIVDVISAVIVCMLQCTTATALFSW